MGVGGNVRDALARQRGISRTLVSLSNQRVLRVTERAFVVSRESPRNIAVSPCARARGVPPTLSLSLSLSKFDECGSQFQIERFPGRRDGRATNPPKPRSRRLSLSLSLSRFLGGGWRRRGHRRVQGDHGLDELPQDEPGSVLVFRVFIEAAFAFSLSLYLSLSLSPKHAARKRGRMHFSRGRRQRQADVRHVHHQRSPEPRL